jgi:hypothetical protein
MTLFIASLLVFLASIFILMALIGLWTYKDAQVKSTQPAGAWALATVFIPNGIGFIAYLLVGRDKKDAPAPGTYKKPLIASVAVFVLAIAFFIVGTVTFAVGESGGGTMNRGVWMGRTVNTRGDQWTENVRRGNGTSRRTVTLNAEQMQNFHIESTSDEGRLYVIFEQGRNLSAVDISFDFFDTVDLLYAHGFAPGRIRITLEYAHTRNARTTLSWHTP